MVDLNCYVATFNCGRTPVDVDVFADHFFDGLTTNLPPDLVVLCLEEIAPIAHAFLGASFLSHYFTQLAAAIDVATAQRFEESIEYESILVRNVGMTAIMVFARNDFQTRVKLIETAGVGVGWWEMGNKGAVAARISLHGDRDEQDTVLTFVAAHLAPMEDAWVRRNEDWENICRGLVFVPDKGHPASVKESQDDADTEPLLSTRNESNRHNGDNSLFAPISNIFFAGDLNYRTSDTPPGPDDYNNWPQPFEPEDGTHHYSHLLAHDQLNREKGKGKTLNHLSEAKITFPPTYKYSSSAQEQAISTSLKQEVNRDQICLWAKHRFPSWCDRILYLESAPPKVHQYMALPVQPTSDHRPVVLSFSITSGPVPKAASSITPPFPIRKDWKEARAAARRYEIVVGLAAYLGLTWEGEALLAGTIVGIFGGYLLLRGMVGA